MTIHVSSNLLGIDIVNKEGIKIEKSNEIKNIRKIGILNLMPTKPETEAQFLRLLNNTGEDILVEFIRLEAINKENSYYSYQLENYKIFSQVKGEIDGLIVTGAPLEKLAFEEVKYIDELRSILDYAKEGLRTALYICWGAQVALNYFYNVNKKVETTKIFGVYNHEIVNYDPIIRGVKGGFKSPHSRHTSLCKEDIENNKELKVIAIAEEGFSHIIKGSCNDYYILGHCEYDKYTLDCEYKRDLSKGLEINMPVNYYKNNHMDSEIKFSWAQDSISIYKNWIINLVKE